MTPTHARCLCILLSVDLSHVSLSHCLKDTPSGPLLFLLPLLCAPSHPDHSAPSSTDHSPWLRTRPPPKRPYHRQRLTESNGSKGKSTPRKRIKGSQHARFSQPFRLFLWLFLGYRLFRFCCVMLSFTGWLSSICLLFNFYSNPPPLALCPRVVLPFPFLYFFLAPSTMSTAPKCVVDRVSRVESSINNLIITYFFASAFSTVCGCDGVWVLGCFSYLSLRRCTAIPSAETEYT